MSEEGNRQDEGSGGEKKITLPSSGLAEDILGQLGREVGGSGVADEPETFEDTTYAGEAGDEEEEETLHLVGFELAGEEYALEISQVQEIIRVGDWTRVPNSPGHIMGVINLRGRIIPVVDPKVRMNQETTGTTKDSRIMIVEAGRKVLGLLVDNVSQVLRLPTRLVEDAPDEVSETNKDFIRGVGKLEGRLIIILDLLRLLGLEEVAA